KTGHHAHAKCFASGSNLAVWRSQRTQMRTRQPELNKHRVSFGADGDDLVGLIGKRCSRGREVAAHGCFAVEHSPGAVEFVARLREGGDDSIPVVLAFEPHMLAHRLDARGG